MGFEGGVGGSNLVTIVTSDYGRRDAQCETLVKIGVFKKFKKASAPHLTCIQFAGILFIMSERILAAIDEIEAQIKTKEAELTPLRITVNHLCQLIGEPARYQVDGPGASGQPKNQLNFRADQFYNRPLAQCVVEYLKAREAAGMEERAAKVQEIYEALGKGGYDWAGVGGGEENRMRSLRISLTKNTTQFSKISEDVFGLKDWYGSPRRKGNGKAASADAEPTVDEAEPENPGNPPVVAGTDDPLAAMRQQAQKT